MIRYRSLAELLGVAKGELIAFVGGGGKTTAMTRLSKEAASRGWTVLASTTTKAGRDVAAAFDLLETPPSLTATADGTFEARLARRLSVQHRVFLFSRPLGDGKLDGVDPELLSRLLKAAAADLFLVEADGSRQRPLKMPAAHEPVIPESARVVCPVVGLDALGRRVAAPWVHRPELVGALARSLTVSTGLIARILVSDRGALKGVPSQARICPILNKVDEVSEAPAIEIALKVLAALPARVDRVAICDIRAGRFSAVEAGPQDA